MKKEKNVEINLEYLRKDDPAPFTCFCVEPYDYGVLLKEASRCSGLKD
ncbi:MAG: hypothetical protein KC733_12430 [Candidatus Omnitrophica bacterium]|nr:hypothetical protein [Candidatus Omnitrophota bacterium]